MPLTSARVVTLRELRTDRVRIVPVASAELMAKNQSDSFSTEGELRGWGERGMVQPRTTYVRGQRKAVRYEEGGPQSKERRAEHWSTLRHAVIRGVGVRRDWRAVAVEEGYAAHEMIVAGVCANERGHARFGLRTRRLDCWRQHGRQPDAYDERKDKLDEANARLPCAAQTVHRAGSLGIHRRHSTIRSCGYRRTANPLHLPRASLLPRPPNKDVRPRPESAHKRVA